MAPLKITCRQIGRAAVAVQAGGGYTRPMRWTFTLLCGLLIGCGLPGRQSFAPDPVPPDAVSINAADAFAGRIALVTIAPGTSDFVDPLGAAVHQALAIKPNAAFEVSAETLSAGSPDASAASLRGMTGMVSDVAKAIIADGVAPARVSLAARTGGGPGVIIYVK